MHGLGRRSSAARKPGPLALVLLLSLLFSCGTAIALSKEGSIRDLRHTAWGPKEGAPGAIASMAQTSDGFLWLGNAGGLFRFDGLRFDYVELPRDPRLSSANIFTLFANPSGGLWIGFTFGGATLLRDGNFTTYTEQDGLPPGSVKAFAQAQDGTIWAGTSSGLARLEGKRWRAVGIKDNYSDAQTEALMVDSAGTLWAGSKNMVLSLRRGEMMFREELRISNVSDQTGNREIGFAESPTGTVWLATDRGLRRLAQNTGNGRVSTYGKYLLFDRDGSVWIAHVNKRGIQRHTHPEQIPLEPLDVSTDTWDSYTEIDGLTQAPGNGPALEDREGNLWIASGTGLDRFAERNVARLAQSAVQEMPHTFSAYEAAIVAADRGALWIGGRTSELFSVPDSSALQDEKLPNVSCALRGDDGTIWLASAATIWKFWNGRFERIALPKGTDNFEVQAIAPDDGGALWVSIVRKGLFRLRDGVWTANGGIDALRGLTAITMASDETGRIWFGFTDGRIALLSGGNVTLFADQTRLAVGNVTAIYAKRGKVWVGGEFGFALFDGKRFRALLPELVPAFNNVTGIVETVDGDLWLNAAAGIVHVTAAEVRRAAEEPAYHIRGEIFNALDGVEGSSARLRPLPTAVEGTDGRLWFATNVGVYSLVPSRIYRNPLPPTVMIQSVIADNRTYVPSIGLKLPQNSTTVRINYVGVSLTMAEKIRYRYKLEGVDKNWQDAQGRREAFYTNLGSGTHKFQVVAANNDGVWNDAGATLEFAIAPTFFQTGWFIALCILGVAILIWMLIRIRDRQMAGRMRGRLEERLAERERIARELHDTLLQSTQGLVLRFQAVANRMSPTDPAREMLDKTLDRADEVMAEGRDRVLDLRVPIDTLSDLSKAFADAGSDLAQGRSVVFRTSVEGATRALVRIVREEVYRIGREALLNAFAHAEAASIEVQLIYGPTEFRLRVRDDGRGIDEDSMSAVRHPGHWGLQGMRERAESIGAQFDVWSRQGAGTEIELRIPASIAYREVGVFARWRRWLRSR